jgi:hypothetical protein
MQDPKNSPILEVWAPSASEWEAREKRPYRRRLEHDIQKSLEQISWRTWFRDWNTRLPPCKADIIGVGGSRRKGWVAKSAVLCAFLQGQRSLYDNERILAEMIEVELAII